MSDEVRVIITDVDLLLLVDCSLIMLDVPLVPAFFERLHKDTSSFHLPCTNMTITLNDVSNLFQFPLVSNFFITPVNIQTIACMKAN